MADFTFIELHLDDAQFSAEAPFSGLRSTGSGSESTEVPFEGAGQSGTTGTSPVRVLAGLVVVGVAIAVARRLRSRRKARGSETASEEPIIAD